MSRKRQQSGRPAGPGAATPVPEIAVKLRSEGLWPEGRARILFFALLAVGAVLRLLWLGRASLQIDEINVIRFALDASSFADVYTTELARFTTMHRLPTLMMLIKLAITLLPFSGGHPPEWIARLPMAILGILALPLFYLLGRRVGNQNTGLWAMLLATLSVYHVFYSREAYDYSIVIFFAVGTLWSSAELLGRARDSAPPPWKWGLLYAGFASVLLHAHLSCLLFLAPWNALMALWLLTRLGTRLFKGGTPWLWAAVLVTPYVLFSPFLLKLGGGFQVTEGDLAHRFSLAVFPAVWGRMGFGESLPALLPFVSLFIAGIAAAFLKPSGARFSLPVILMIELVIYFAVQSWSLRVSRFEIRYYSPAFPLLLLFAASGIEWLLARVSARGRVAATLAAASVIGAVAAPSLLAVCELDTRGYNYKGIASWLGRNLPERSVYAFYNIYELRGVPHVYPTPGRDATSVAAWSSNEDFVRADPPARAKSLFTRFPQVVFVEITPEDLCNPEMARDPINRAIDREGPFMRHEWLGDPAADRLFKWKTHPLGETQWNNSAMHRTYFSYNLASDMPALARKNGRSFYHYFGPGWQYANDQGFNHWMAVRDKADLIIGNITASPAFADIHLKLLSPSPACRVQITDARGNHVATLDIGNRSISDAVLRARLLPPGETTYHFRRVGAGPDAPPAYLYSAEPVHSAEGKQARDPRG